MAIMYRGQLSTGRLLASLYLFLLGLSGARADFFDDFQRADSDAIGNGWIEETDRPFQIVGGAVVKGYTSSIYRDNAVFRPAAENGLDVEVQSELRLSAATPGYPQILARLQTDTVFGYRILDAYMLVIYDSATTAYIGRQNGGNSINQLATINISPALNNNDLYRLRLRAVGTNPVELSAWIERWDGAGWQLTGQASYSDADSNRIATAGSTGIGGHKESGYSFDNFNRIDIGGGGTNNPQPVTSGLSPSSAMEGESGLLLTVSGADFVPGSIVRWNGADRATTFVSSTELEAGITAGDLAAAGSATVSVFSPAPGGGLSNPQTFTITPNTTNNPLPTTSGLAPNAVTEGTPGLSLTVLGSNFASTAVVRWNGADRMTAFVSPGELTAQIGAADLAAPGTANVTVFNPAPGGGVSNGQTFTIEQSVPNNPLPSTSGLTPSSATAGAGALTLTVQGSGFIAGSSVRWNGSARTTNFVSASQLTAQITAADLANSGSATVTVFNPSPGGGVSNGQTFTINPGVPNNPAPTTTGLSPSSTPAGSGGLTLSVFGQNFISASTVRWNGSNRTTTFISAGELRATIPGSDVASSGSASVTVFTPSPGGGLSNAQLFTISSGGGGQNPLPSIGSLQQQSSFQGDSGATFSLYGAGFIAQSTVRWNGQPRTTQFVSAAEVRVTLTAADLQAKGQGILSVLNPPPGGGSSGPHPYFVLENGTNYFFDSFNRPDSPDVGNGWTEKYPDAYSIVGSGTRALETSVDFHDAIVYRPQTEDKRDVEIGMEFTRLPAVGDSGFTQLHARIQRNVINLEDTLHSYIFFVDDFAAPPGRAIFAIQPPVTDMFECYMKEVLFPSELVEGDRYRLRFRVEGVAPVVLTGFVEHFVDGAWEVFASGTTTHDENTQRDPNLYCIPGEMPPPIIDYGAVGFAKWRTRTDALDNYYWVDTGASNLVPYIGQLLPASGLAGGGTFELIVNGAEFLDTSVVRWNGANRATTFVSPSQLRATITAADIAAAGEATVTVFSPAPGGGASNPRTFTIQPAGSTFTDDFNRPNSPDIGNAWIEENPGAFSLVAGEVEKQSTTAIYRDNPVYRPAAENLRDVEASIEFRRTGSQPRYPQVLTRMQTDTSVYGDRRLDTYLLYVDNNASLAIIGRQQGGNSISDLASLALSQPLNTTDRYRLRLSTVGIAPVQLNGYVERWNGAGWDIIGQGSYADSSSNAITTSGSTGFNGHKYTGYSFDNFSRVDLTP